MERWQIKIGNRFVSEFGEKRLALSNDFTRAFIFHSKEDAQTVLAALPDFELEEAATKQVIQIIN